MTNRWLLGMILPLVLAAAFTPTSAKIAKPFSSSLFFVRLRSAPPVGVYKGGIAGFPATAPAAAPFAATRPAASGNASAAGVAGAARRRPRIHLKSSNVRAFGQYLRRQQQKIAAEVGVSLKKVVHNFRFAAHGFAASLTPLQAWRLRRHPAVASVSPSHLMYPRTTHSPRFMRMANTLWAQAGGQGSAGEDVVIGVIDSGIWPEHNSFTPSTLNLFGPAPSQFVGPCQTTSDFPSCNGKVVGARFLYQGLNAMGFAVDTTADYLSPRDGSGHGSWCAGAAAGNSDVSGSRRFLDAELDGSASGMAPRARIAVYKAVWAASKRLPLSRYGVSSNVDVLTAVDLAIADGVDVLSISLGAFDSQATYFDDIVYLNAFASGVTVVFSAGNMGMSVVVRSIEHFSPFYLTVGASTISRRVNMGGAAIATSSLRTKAAAAAAATQTAAAAADPQLEPETGLLEGEPTSSTTAAAAASAGGGDVSQQQSLLALASPLEGVRLFGRWDSLKLRPMVRGVKAGKRRGDTKRARLCLPGSLSPARVLGRVVVCASGGASPAGKAAAVAAAGGVGMVLAGAPDTMSDKVAAGNGILPVMVLDDEASESLLVHTNARRTIPTPLLFFRFLQILRAPVVARWSSTGPVARPAFRPILGRPVNDILKPDVIAPGVRLWAATPSEDSPSRMARMSGSSMAAPHVAGIAALVLQLNPAFTPGQIMSAICTSAKIYNVAGRFVRMWHGGRATPWAMGSGHVNPIALQDPGLVFPLVEADLKNFLAGQDVETAKKNFPLDTLTPIFPYSLNRPSISVSHLVGTVQVERRVINVALQTSNYRAQIVEPAFLTITVDPPSFTAGPGDTVIFFVNITSLLPRPGWVRFASGSITWVDNNNHAVRIPIQVQPSVFNIT